VVTRDLREIWKPVAAIGFAMSGIEPAHNSRADSFPASGRGNCDGTRIGENVGMVNLAIPSITLKTMGRDSTNMDQPSIGKPRNRARHQAEAHSRPGSHSGVVYSRNTILMRDLLNLSVGRILTLRTGVR